MLFFDRNQSIDPTKWQRINMRKVSSLIGAEMIHNLYDRHWPRINSLRFRNTITNVRSGVVESFAPIEEWQYLQEWLSKKFRDLDPVLIREIDAIINPDYLFVNEIMAKVDNCDLTSATNEGLGLLLIDIMDYPLGEIYKLNVVQIEYSLNFALQGLLAEYEPNITERNELLTKLIAPGVLTVSQEIELNFTEIVQSGRNQGVPDPESDELIYSNIAHHHQTYAPAYCAYGEEPPTLNYMLAKYRQLYKNGARQLSRAEVELTIRKSKEESEQILSHIGDPQIAELCRLMARIGVFRDKNKAKLGETVLRRFAITEAIARRKRISKHSLNHYLMTEIMNLLMHDICLTEEMVRMRSTQGVSFVRSETVLPNIIPMDKRNPFPSKRSDTSISGVCASPGMVSGPVRIILSKDDIHKIRSGEIMVAIGTDFDLLEAMEVSGGIITEEGGLLSHASVVSREQKKPCLIGVPNATKLLQDGCVVFLNATEGIVELKPGDRVSQ